MQARGHARSVLRFVPGGEFRSHRMADGEAIVSAPCPQPVRGASKARPAEVRGLSGLSKTCPIGVRTLTVHRPAWRSILGARARPVRKKRLFRPITVVACPPTLPLLRLPPFGVGHRAWPSVGGGDRFFGAIDSVAARPASSPMDSRSEGCGGVGWRFRSSIGWRRDGSAASKSLPARPKAPGGGVARSPRPMDGWRSRAGGQNRARVPSGTPIGAGPNPPGLACPACVSNARVWWRPPRHPP